MFAEFRLLLDRLEFPESSTVTGLTFWSFEKNVPPLDLAGIDKFHDLMCLVVFDGQRLSPSAFSEIAKCRNIIAVVIPTAQLNNDDLKQLLNLKNLQILDVSMSQIDNDSIDALASMTNLRLLNISGTRLTLRGGEELRRRIPAFVVSFDRWAYGSRDGTNWSNFLKRIELEKTSN